MKVRRADLIAILTGGLVAGTIDVSAAALINMLSPLIILHFIAGGILGRVALAGGAAIDALGLILQWLMSIVIALIYVLASSALPELRRLWILGGLVYGVGIFFVMNYVVVPFSAWKRWPNFTVDRFAENMAAMLLFGLIVAFFAHRAEPAQTG